MPKPRLPENDGWTPIDYDFGLPAEDNVRVGNILNEACHVFRHHAYGMWAERDKDFYAGALASELTRYPRLIGRLLSTKDRVVKMVTYRAISLSKELPPPQPEEPKTR